MKKEVLAGVLLAMLINFASAAFSVGDMLNRIDPSTIFLGTVFIIVLFIVNYALNRFFNKFGTANMGISVVSLALALFTVYGLNRAGIDGREIFSSFGIGENALTILLAIILIVGAIYFIIKFKLRGFLIALGGFLLYAVFFTNWIYEEMVVGIIGAVLLALGLWLVWRHKRRLAGFTSGIMPTASKVGSAMWGGAKGVGKAAGWAGKNTGKAAQWAATGGYNVAPAWGPKAVQANIQQKVIEKQRKKLQQELQIRYNKIIKRMIDIEKVCQGPPPQGNPLQKEYDLLKNSKGQLRTFARQNGFTL